MRLLRWIAVSCVAVSMAACSSGNSDTGGTGVPAGDDGGAGEAGTCGACVNDNSCAGGGSCAQLAGDTFCVPKCSGTTCAAGSTCQLTTDYAGNQVSVCVPSSGACAVSGDAGTTDSSAAHDASTACGTLVPPTTTASCHSCPAGTACQANGCYGGWWCDTSVNKCHAPPTSCPGSGGDSGTTPPPVDAGPVPTGSVGPSGGKVSRLFFAVVGDTRPPIDDDTAGYPTSTITSIYKNVAAAAPQFVVSTGDYMFASPARGESSKQLDLYLSARAAYSGTLFPALGNHECTGAVISNCGAGNADGPTLNYTNFIAKMLTPIGQSKPYYSIRVDAIDGSWTSKFVFIAANAWDSTQQAWLDSALSVSTTYTFILRHEPAAANNAPGVTPSETIMAAHPYTLAIVGHTHLYARHYPREVVFGNGGAPLTGTSNYGFGIIQMRSDGAIQVDEHDWSTGAVDPAFTFALKADGTPTR